MSGELTIALPQVSAEDLAELHATYTCSDCKEERPSFQFGKYPSGRRKPVCQKCLDRKIYEAHLKRQKRKKKKRKPKRAPHPCRHCNGVIERVAPQSRVNALTFCSPECHRNFLRRGRVCSRCGEFKAYECFGRYDQHVRKRPQCIPCKAKNRYFEDGRECMRPTLAAMIHTVRRMATRRNVGFYLPEDIARAMYNGQCQFCGGQVQFFLPLPNAGAFTQESLRPVCHRCHRMIKHFGVTEMLCAAYEITAHNGLGGKPPRQESSHVEDA